jgi:IclR family pca regulon transcriptional regulator
MQGHTVAALNVVLSGARYQEEALRRDMLPLLFEAAREVRALL